jgi:hypothetical protein
MKKLLLILFITLFYFSQSKAQIWSHNFESSGGYTTSDGESTSGILYELMDQTLMQPFQTYKAVTILQHKTLMLHLHLY